MQPASGSMVPGTEKRVDVILVDWDDILPFAGHIFISFYKGVSPPKQYNYLGTVHSNDVTAT